MDRRMERKYMLRLYEALAALSIRVNTPVGGVAYGEVCLSSYPGYIVRVTSEGVVSIYDGFEGTQNARVLTRICGVDLSRKSWVDDAAKAIQHHLATVLSLTVTPVDASPKGGRRRKAVPVLPPVSEPVTPWGGNVLQFKPRVGHPVWPAGGILEQSKKRTLRPHPSPPGVYPSPPGEGWVPARAVGAMGVPVYGLFFRVGGEAGIEVCPQWPDGVDVSIARNRIRNTAVEKNDVALAEMVLRTLAGDPRPGQKPGFYDKNKRNLHPSNLCWRTPKTYAEPYGKHSDEVLTALIRRWGQTNLTDSQLRKEFPSLPSPGYIHAVLLGIEMRKGVAWRRHEDLDPIRREAVLQKWALGLPIADSMLPLITRLELTVPQSRAGVS